MGWSSFIDGVTQAAQSVAKADSDFKKGVASGAWQGLKSMATGFKDLAVGGYHLVTDPAAQQRAGQVLSKVADAGGRLITDPAARAQAYDQTAQAIGRAREQFAAAHKRAADEGRLASFYGEAAGRVGFEVGAIFVPVTKLGMVAKAGKAAEVADVVADTGKVVRAAEGLSEVRPSAVTTVCEALGEGGAKGGQVEHVATTGVSRAATPDLVGVPINGATRTVPLGFHPPEQFATAAQQLQDALAKSGITDATVGVRGSSVTGFSLTKGTAFGPQSDIDFFIESRQLTAEYTKSRNIPGFVHPGKILPDYPLLQDWSAAWTKMLGRDVTPGAFVPGTLPSQPTIVVKP